ncbi:PDR/VanB family oxidoreductase [Actinomycetospora corticicola]|uniref:Ferredoxin-NADP reductase n=1 Tax=Actinomycetospora corticicola TaxID=663602 RepID=A0A7Y9DXZ2_9PSEU|nr:ferredoxin-NADP reductase [Actinomycetospora corticicola]
MDDTVMDLEVVGLRREADGVLSVELRDRADRLLPSWGPGAHVDLVVGGHVRQYSLCGDPAERRRYRVAVLREPASRGGSTHVHDRLRPGDEVEVGGPRNHFPLADASRHLLVAGGIGITPVLTMAADLAARGADWRLVYLGRARRGMAFLDELSVLDAGAGRVTLHTDDVDGIPDLDTLLTGLDPSTAVAVCGPAGLIAAVEAHCAARGLPVPRAERFAAVERDADEVLTPFDVVVASTGARITVPAHRSALEVLDEAGVGLPNACRDGVCGSCLVRVVAGEPWHRDALTAPDRTDVLAPCVSRARGAELVLDL